VCEAHCKWQEVQRFRHTTPTPPTIPTRVMFICSFLVTSPSTGYPIQSYPHSIRSSSFSRSYPSLVLVIRVLVYAPMFFSLVLVASLISRVDLCCSCLRCLLLFPCAWGFEVGSGFSGLWEGWCFLGSCNAVGLELLWCADKQPRCLILKSGFLGLPIKGVFPASLLV